MTHKHFKIISNGRELSYPNLRMFSLLVCIFLYGMAWARAMHLGCQ